MKNAIKILFSCIAAIISLLSSCGQSDSTYQTEHEIRLQVGGELIEAVMSKDTEGVKSLLCPYFIENHENLDEEIQGIFDFIDGDVMSYEKIWSSGGGGTQEYGKWVKKRIDTEIIGISTNTGNIYKIYFDYYLVNQDEPDMLGIVYLNVVSSSDEQDDTITHYEIIAREKY